MARHFTDLPAWRAAHSLDMLVYELSKQLLYEHNATANRLRRIAAANASNIAYGYISRSPTVRTQFYRASLALSSEIELRLQRAAARGFLQGSAVPEAIALARTVQEELHSLLEAGF